MIWEVETQQDVKLLFASVQDYKRVVSGAGTFPKSVVAQIVVTSQALIGYGMLGGMLAILSNKLARRAD